MSSDALEATLSPTVRAVLRALVESHDAPHETKPFTNAPTAMLRSARCCIGLSDGGYLTAEAMNEYIDLLITHFGDCGGTMALRCPGFMTALDLLKTPSSELAATHVKNEDIRSGHQPIGGGDCLVMVPIFHLLSGDEAYIESRGVDSRVRSGHWTLVVVYPQRLKIHYFDSLYDNQHSVSISHTNQLRIRCVAGYINHYRLLRHHIPTNKNWSIVLQGHAESQCGSECGVYVLKAMESAARQWQQGNVDEYKSALTAREMAQARLQIMCSIAEKRLVEESEIGISLGQFLRLYELLRNQVRLNAAVAITTTALPEAPLPLPPPATPASALVIDTLCRRVYDDATSNGTQPISIVLFATDSADALRMCGEMSVVLDSICDGQRVETRVVTQMRDITPQTNIVVCVHARLDAPSGSPRIILSAFKTLTHVYDTWFSPAFNHIHSKIFTTAHATGARPAPRACSSKFISYEENLRMASRQKIAERPHEIDGVSVCYHCAREDTI